MLRRLQNGTLKRKLQSGDCHKDLEYILDIDIYILTEDHLKNSAFADGL